MHFYGAKKNRKKLILYNYKSKPVEKIFIRALLVNRTVYIVLEFFFNTMI